MNINEQVYELVFRKPLTISHDFLMEMGNHQYDHPAYRAAMYFFNGLSFVKDNVRDQLWNELRSREESDYFRDQAYRHK